MLALYERRVQSVPDSALTQGSRFYQLMLASADGKYVVAAFGLFAITPQSRYRRGDGRSAG